METSDPDVFIFSNGMELATLKHHMETSLERVLCAEIILLLKE